MIHMSINLQEFETKGEPQRSLISEWAKRVEAHDSGCLGINSTLLVTTRLRSGDEGLFLVCDGGAGGVGRPGRRVQLLRAVRHVAGRAGVRLRALHREGAAALRDRPAGEQIILT